MGRNESSGGGAIAVIVIVFAVSIIFIVGLAAAGAGFFFLARSSSLPPLDGPGSVTVSSGPATSNDAIVIETDDDGTVLFDGQSYSDEEFRQILSEHVESDQPIELTLGENISDERRAEIQAIYDAVVRQAGQ